MSTGAQAIIKDGKIEISIDVDALPMIVSGSSCCVGVDSLWKVTDAAAFAKEVCYVLNDEREDGATPVHVMFDTCLSGWHTQTLATHYRLCRSKTLGIDRHG